MSSQRWYPAFLKVFSGQLVSAAYQGILRRPPEEGGRDVYTSELVRTRDFSKILESISRSDELWRQLVEERSTSESPSLSRAAIIWAYRLFLGREPESETAIRNHLPFKTVAELRRHFLQSEEFQRAIEPFLSRELEFPIGLPKDQIQTQATAAQLEECIAKVSATWAALGAEKPHFSVLTDTRYLPENLAGNLENFWASGEAEADTAMQVLRRHGRDDIARMDCVEYGCGVGRVSLALAKRMRSVNGYDISPAHLALAAERAEQVGAQSLRLHRRTDPAAPLEACDFFYSRIVFQHNPPPLIVMLIRLALRSLRPNGIAMFQLPTYKSGYRFNFADWLRRPPATDMEMHCVPQAQVFAIAAEENCAVLEVREDGSSGEGYLSNMFVMQKRA